MIEKLKVHEMEVITIETSAFKLLISKIDALELQLSSIEKKSTVQKLYNNKSLSELLQVSRRTLQTYRDEGLISFSQVKDTISYTQADVDEFLEAYKCRAYAKKKK